MFLTILATFNWSWLIIAAGLGIMLGLLVSNRNKWDKTKLSVLNIEDFLNTMRKGSLIDVRKPEEFEKGKIVGARNFPRKSGATDGRVRKDLPIFIYDEAGSSSMRGIGAKYIKKGAVQVYILKGGYKAYLENKGMKKAD